MSQINENEIKKRFEKISKFQTSPEITARDLEQMSKNLTKLTSEQHKSGHNIWSIIMKSKITKFAAAAVIVIASFIILNQVGVKVDVTNTALAEVVESMNKMSWLHQVVNGTEDNNEVTAEQWVSFDSKICAIKRSDGYRMY